MAEETNIPEAAQEMYDQADALEELADDVANAESIAEDVPALSELFHEVRTSRRKGRDGRYVALLDHSEDGWKCRNVAFLETGTHYRDTGADALVSFKAFPFLSIDLFADHVSGELRRDARAARQSASGIEESARESEMRRKYHEGEL